AGFALRRERVEFLLQPFLGGFAGVDRATLALASARGIAVLSGRPWSPRGPAVRLQSEEERSRPRCAGDLSRERGKRAVTRALPSEAVIEHQYIIGSTLPFSNQPSSRLQLGTRTYPPLLAPVELLSKLTELTLPL